LGSDIYSAWIFETYQQFFSFTLVSRRLLYLIFERWSLEWVI